MDGESHKTDKEWNQTRSGPENNLFISLHMATMTRGGRFRLRSRKLDEQLIQNYMI